MKLVNLTPHDIDVVKDGYVEGAHRVIPRSGEVARVESTYEDAGELNGFALVKREFGEIEGLPAPAPKTRYVVSGWVFDAAVKNGRTDVICPDTGPSAVRDENGRIVAVRHLICP